MTSFKVRILIISALVAFSNAQNAFRLANFYQNDMVLQMEPKSAVLWGYGEPGARIEINFESDQVVSAVNDDGTWKVTLPPQKAGGPVDFEIIHNNEDTATLSAWFGDVWVCSGQSNMAMAVNAVFNSTEEITKALTYQNIRLLKVKREFNLDTELAEVTTFATPWGAPDNTNVPSFSALCLFYGERMSDSFNNTKPIGLIDASWGGTRIEAWISQRVPIYCLTPENDGSEHNSESALWNAMIHPLTKSTVRGAIWYQGEANVGKNPDFYACHMAALVQDWKNTFQQGTILADNDVAFPFGIVQIGPTTPSENYAWGALRFHQTADVGTLPNPFIPEGFMAAAYDLTDAGAPTGDIHPRDKQTVADRLSNAAKSLLYNENFKKNGPVPILVSEDILGQITFNYDMKIRIGGSEGFAFKRVDGTWSAASIISSTATSVTVSVDSEATLLTLGYRAAVCAYKQCAIYSDDAENLPAQVWQLDVSSIRRK